MLLTTHGGITNLVPRVLCLFSILGLEKRQKTLGMRLRYHPSNNFSDPIVDPQSKLAITRVGMTYKYEKINLLIMVMSSRIYFPNLVTRVCLLADDIRRATEQCSRISESQQALGMRLLCPPYKI